LHPAAVRTAFTAAKNMAIGRLFATSASKTALPFMAERLQQARALLGRDHWSYGFAANRSVLERFLRHHHAQGLSKRLLKPEELFHPSTLEAPTI